MEITDIKDRIDIPVWLNDKGMTGSAVEIGVCQGGFAHGVLKLWQGKEYVMVDPWKQQPRNVYKECTDGMNYDTAYAACVGLTKEYPIAKTMRMLSVDAVPKFPDNYFDWVYIDGNHCFEAVMQDLDGWYPKLKVGGVFSGHDFYTDINWPHWCEVKKAVMEWLPKHGYSMDDIHRMTCSSWMLIKR